MNDEITTTLLLRLPVDLKGSFQGLCNARGVSVSEELRRFMADEVASAALGMTTNDRPRNKAVAKKIPVVKASVKQSSAPVANKAQKCDRTEDMFENESKVDRQKRLMSEFEDRKTRRAMKPAKSTTDGGFKLSEGVMAGITARDKRKKTKK